VRVLVSGATGLIGSAVVARLGQTGHAAIRLVRTDPDRGGTDVRWDPAKGALDAAPLEGLDAVVHLAGEDIASGAWSRSIMDIRPVSYAMSHCGSNQAMVAV